MKVTCRPALHLLSGGQVWGTGRGSGQSRGRPVHRRRPALAVPCSSLCSAGVRGPVAGAKPTRAREGTHQQPSWSSGTGSMSTPGQATNCTQCWVRLYYFGSFFCCPLSPHDFLLYFCLGLTAVLSGQPSPRCPGGCRACCRHHTPPLPLGRRRRHQLALRVPPRGGAFPRRPWQPGLPAGRRVGGASRPLFGRGSRAGHSHTPGTHLCAQDTGLTRRSYLCRLPGHSPAAATAPRGLRGFASCFKACRADASHVGSRPALSSRT